jgi:hypothetical protein
MIAPRPRPVTSETWNGHWGPDARYYARRSDGVCFAIDSAVNVFDLAGTTPPAPHARLVDSLPVAGEYTLSVFAQRPVDASHVKPSIDGPSPIHPRITTARLLACGVRRRK